jgi:hypothetical protein
VKVHRRVQRLQNQLEEHRHPEVPELHVEHDGRRAAPFQVDLGRPAVAQRVLLEEQLDGRVDEVADVRMVFGPDEGDEVDDVDQPQLRRHVLETVRQRLFAGARVPVVDARLLDEGFHRAKVRRFPPDCRK